MSKIAVLTTGGTIASIKNENSGLYMSGAMSGEQLVNRERVGLATHIEVESVFQVPSNAMDFGKLLRLRDRILQHIADPDVDGVVVTHGTDTLEESSYFLDLVLESEKPVVFTGAQRTPCGEGTDAYTNIRDAIVAAASPDCRGIGVLVVFNEGVYSARHVHKMHAYNVQAFTSPGFGQLGYVDNGECFITQNPVRRVYCELTGTLGRVDIVKAYLGCDGKIIDFFADSGVLGIVLDGLGRGHVTPGCMDAVQRAVDKGVHVVITSNCGQGRVYPVYDFAGGVRDLQARGVILGHDYTSLKARIKLMVLLASGHESSIALQKAFLA
jgi:L-asparaginase